MKYYIFGFLFIFYTVSVFFAGYKYGSSTIQNTDIDVIQSDTKTEVIKTVNVKDEKEVKKLAESKIAIKRDYAFNSKTNSIVATIVATNYNQQSTVIDTISYKQKSSYNTKLIIGGVAFVAGVAATIYVLNKNKMIKIPAMNARF